jgi:hypothetical protein
MAKPDLQIAFEALCAKQKPYTRLWDYYDGRQPLIYSAERLRKIFSKIDARFTQNWCSVVIDAAADRIDLQKFLFGTDEQREKDFDELWKETEMSLDSDDAHKCALVTGEAYVIAWRTEKGLEAYYNDSRQCHVVYDSEHPRVKRFAAKWWIDEEERRRMILYYPDRFEYYISTKKAESLDSQNGWKDMQAEEVASVPNPESEIPVFHLRRERRAIRSELDSILDLQDAINKLLADMMVGAEFGAFKQRYVISNADVKSLKNAPNEIWTIPAGDDATEPTKVGEFGETQLKNFYEAIGELANSIAIISRTPKHYFMSQGGDPSGEALIAMESPLVKKVETLIERFDPVWQDVARFMLKLQKSEVKKSDITPVFASPQTIQPRTAAEIRDINVRAGMPLKTTLRNEGWSDADLKQLEADQKEESAVRIQEKAQVAEMAMKQFDRGGSQPE